MDYDIDDSDLIMLDADDDVSTKIEFEQDVNIINLFTNKTSLPSDLFDISLANLNKHNWIPWVDFTRKMSESDEKKNDVYKFEDDAIIQSTKAYAEARFSIYKNKYDFSYVADALQHILLCPFEAPLGDAYKLPDRDCVRLNHETDILYVHRLIGHVPPHLYDGDKVLNKGFFIRNKPDNIDNYITFDSAAYIKRLTIAIPGEKFDLVLNDKRLLAIVAENVPESHLVLNVGKKMVSFNLKDFEKNRFMLYPSSGPKHEMYGKEVFLFKNVLIKGSDPRPCVITGDDVLNMMPNLSYQGVHDMFPDIDNQVFDARSWKRLGGDSGDKRYSGDDGNDFIKMRPMSLQEMSSRIEQHVDDIVLLKSCHHKKARVYAQIPAASLKSSSPKASSPRASKSSKHAIFLSTTESLEDPIAKFNAKALAYLVLGKKPFKIMIDPKKTSKGYNEFPMNYKVFELKHLELPSGKIIWFKHDEVSETMLHTSSAFAKYENPEIVQDLDEYMARSLEVYHTLKRADMSVILPIDYTDYQGQNDFDPEEFIVEFGSIGDVIKPDDDDDDNINIKNDDFLAKLMRYAKIKLPGGQIQEIKRCLLVEKDPSILLKNILVTFSLFVIFAQCNLPKVVVGNVDAATINSFPIGSSYALIDHFVKIILKIEKNDYRRILKASIPAVWQGQLIKVCKLLLSKKPTLKVHLDAATPNGKAASNAASNAASKSVVWKPIVNKTKHVEHLMKLEVELDPIAINKRIMTNVKIKPQTTKHVQLFMVKGEHKKHKINDHTKIEQVDNHLLKDTTMNVTAMPDLQTVLGTIVDSNEALKEDPMFHNLYNVTKNEVVWNELSMCVKEIQKINPSVDAAIKTVDNHVLLECLVYDIKDFLGKYAYNYVSADNFAHIDQIKLTRLDASKVKWVLKKVLNFSSFTIYPADEDLTYALQYILIKTMWYIECIDRNIDINTDMNFTRRLCDTNMYILKIINDKQVINSIDVKSARNKYEVIRENRKKSIMKLYGNMDSEGRRGLKKVVNMGLVDIDDVLKNTLSSMNDDFDNSNANAD